MVEGAPHVPQYTSEQQQGQMQQQQEQQAFQSGLQQHPGNGGPTPDANFQNEQVGILMLLQTVCIS